MIRAIVSYVVDMSFDLRYGTQTAGRIKLADLEVLGENKKYGSQHKPTKARPFRKVLNCLRLPQNSVFVDFGSGMGKTLLLALEHGFKRIVGIEFSPDLCEIAKKNISIFKKKYKTVSDAEIIMSDVTHYEIRDDENVFYFYHPFNGIVMNVVLKKISQSLKTKERKIWLIYNNPVCHDLIEKQGRFKKLSEISLIDGKFYIYTN